MPSPVHHQHEHGSRRSRSGGFPNVRQRYASIHVHGGHDRVVPYDPDCCFGTGSPSAFRRGVYYPSLTGRAFGSGTFFSFLLRRPRSLAVVALGAGVGVPPTHPRCTLRRLSRCRPVGFRDEAFKPIRRLSDYSAKNVSAVPESFHNQSLSKSLACPVPQHGRTRGQTLGKECQKRAA